MASFYRRQVLQQALSIVWRKKYLWFLGFFAGLFAYGGETDILFRNTSSPSWLQDNLAAFREVVQAGGADKFLEALKNFFTGNFLYALGFLAAILLTMVAVFWLVFISQGALVRIVGKSDERKPTGLFDGLSVGGDTFWRIVGLNIITKLFIWGMWVILAGLPAIAYFLYKQPQWLTTFTIGALLVSLPVTIIVSFLTKYATAFIVLGGQNIIESLRKAWRMFTQNWLVSIELAIIIYFINLAATIVVAGIVTLLIPTPGSFTELFIILGSLALVYAIESAFSFACWTIIYRRLLEGKPGSRIGAWTSRLTNFMEDRKTIEA